MQCRWIFFGTFPCASESWFCFLQSSRLFWGFTWAPSGFSASGGAGVGGAGYVGLPTASVTVVYLLPSPCQDAEWPSVPPFWPWASDSSFSWALVVFGDREASRLFLYPVLLALCSMCSIQLEQKAEMTYGSMSGAPEGCPREVEGLLILLWSSSPISYWLRKFSCIFSLPLITT